MGSITYRKDRKLRWRGDIHHGDYRKNQSFKTKEEVRLWIDEEEKRYRMRNTPEHGKLHNYDKLREGGFKVFDLLMFCLDEHCADIGLPDRLRIQAFARTQIANMPVLDIKKHHALAFFKQLPKEQYKVHNTNVWKQYSSTSAHRLRNILQTIYQRAIDNTLWGLCHVLENPFSGLNLDGTKRAKKRRLLPGEEEKLLEQFKKCHGRNKYYAPLAMALAVDTGMHLQEIVNLKWRDIDFADRRITITKHKSDKKRREAGDFSPVVIVLPYKSMSLLIELQKYLNGKDGVTTAQDANVFINVYGKPLSPGALSDVFGDAVRDASLPLHNGENLTFSCLRREANSRFRRCLIQEQCEVMLGQFDTDGNTNRAHYTDIEELLRPIQNALDKHVFKRGMKDSEGNPINVGMTLREAVKRFNGKEISNAELLAEGEIPVALTHKVIFVERWDHYGKKIIITASNELGHHTLQSAVKLPSCSAEDREILEGQLVSLDELYGGELDAHGYIFTSEAKFLETRKSNKFYIVEDVGGISVLDAK